MRFHRSSSSCSQEHASRDVQTLFKVDHDSILTHRLTSPSRIRLTQVVDCPPLRRPKTKGQSVLAAARRGPIGLARRSQGSRLAGAAHARGRRGRIRPHTADQRVRHQSGSSANWPTCFSAIIAGGGIRGGMVYGESDKTGGGEKVCRNEWHFHVRGVEFRTATGRGTYCASDGSRLGQQVVRFGSTLNGARFNAIRTVSDAVGCDSEVRCTKESSLHFVVEEERRGATTRRSSAGRP